jgi:hypothetical protein
MKSNINGGHKKIPGTQYPGDAVFHPCCQALDPRRDDTLFVMGRSSGFRFVLLAALPIIADSGFSAFVPGHSGGSATDFHRFPSSPPKGIPITDFSKSQID